MNTCTHTPTHWHTNSPKCTQAYTHKHTYTHLAGDTSTAQGVQIIAPRVRHCSAASRAVAPEIQFISVDLSLICSSLWYQVE